MTARVLSEIAAERAAQDVKWGEQNHPDGTGGLIAQEEAAIERAWTNDQAAAGVLTWADILQEEVSEAFAEDDPAKLRAELVQVAAVAVAWVAAIDRRASRVTPGELETLHTLDHGPNVRVPARGGPVGALLWLAGAWGLLAAVIVAVVVICR
jgi:hypothetical protein